MREKLIELLKEADRKAYEVAESRPLAHPFEVWEIQADHLIANGVTVPPCKVGDEVYEIYEEEHETFRGKCRRCDTDCSSYDICWHYEYEWKIRNRTVDRRYLFENWDRFGTGVFLTKEEAETALIERRKEC